MYGFHIRWIWWVFGIFQPPWIMVFGLFFKIFSQSMLCIWRERSSCPRAQCCHYLISTTEACPFISYVILEISDPVWTFVEMMWTLEYQEDPENEIWSRKVMSRMEMPMEIEFEDMEQKKRKNGGAGGDRFQDMLRCWCWCWDGESGQCGI